LGISILKNSITLESETAHQQLNWEYNWST